MTATVVPWPRRVMMRDVSWLPSESRSQVALIEHWHASTAHALATLPGVTPAHHKVLRQMADTLLAELWADALTRLETPRPVL